MRRRQKEIMAMQRQAKIWTASLHRVDDYTGKFEKTIGRFRKKHAQDCGHTNCSRCARDTTKYQLLKRIHIREINLD
jgi:hypothetical protein